ncbi:MAG: hypothetical protein NTW87_23025 [Planctomycetota bacterium]|nr:hypothetical protein [Planctomycetota bacterium]
MSAFRICVFGCLSLAMAQCHCELARSATGVGDPQLMTDHPFWQGELSCSTFERLAKNQADIYSRVAGQKTDNDEDKAIASWYWRNTHYFHCTLLAEPDIFKKGAHEVVRDYWAGLFSYGHSMCQENHYQYTAEMEYLLGHARARAVNVEGHTSFEVWVTGGAYDKGKWVLLDSDITTICFDKEQKAMMNIEELTKANRQQMLTNRAAKDNRGWLPELYPGDGVGTYTRIIYYALLCGYAGAPPIVNLRPGESLRRFPRPGLGEGEKGTLVYWGISVDGLDGPNRHITYVTDPSTCFNATKRPNQESDPNRRGRFGNAVFTYKPDFKSSAAVDDTSVTIEHCSPFIIACKPAKKNCLEAGATLGLVVTGKADCKICVSTDGMKTFSDPVDFKDGLDLTDLVKGHYQYWLKFMAPAASLTGKDVTITTRCMANGYVMPHLKADGTQVTFNASGLAAETIGPQADSIAKNIVAGGLDKPSFTVKLKTPHGEKIKTVCWAVRSPSGCPPKPDLAYKAEYSKDGNEWKVLRDDWRIVPPVPYQAPDTWSQSFFYGTQDIASADANAETGTAGEVQVRISNNMGKPYQMGQFSVLYATKNAAKTKVTYAWTEGGQDKTAEHVYPAGATMDTSWKIETNPATGTAGKEPKLKWVEMTPVE